MSRDKVIVNYDTFECTEQGFFVLGSIHRNIIYKRNSNGEFEYKKAIDVNDPFTRTCTDGKNIYIIAPREGKLFTYKTRENCIECVNVPIKEKACNIELIGKKIVCVYNLTANIAIYDLEKGNWKVECQFRNPMGDSQSEKGNKTIAVAGKVNDNLYLLLEDGKSFSLLRYELIHNRWIMQMNNLLIDEEINPFSFESYKEYIVLFTKSKTLFAINTITREQSITARFDRTEIDEHAYIAVTEQNIWIFPTLGTDIYIFNRIRKELQKYTDYPKDFIYLGVDPRVGKYCCRKKNEGWIYLSNKYSNYSLRINQSDGTGVWEKSQRVVKLGDTSEMQHTPYIVNERDLTMDEFLEISIRTHTVNNTQSQGEAIWKALSK